jgi:hypothetical protein
MVVFPLPVDQVMANKLFCKNGSLVKSISCSPRSELIFLKAIFNIFIQVILYLDLSYFNLRLAEFISASHQNHLYL